MKRILELLGSTMGRRAGGGVNDEAALERLDRLARAERDREARRIAIAAGETAGQRAASRVRLHLVR